MKKINYKKILSFSFLLVFFLTVFLSSYQKVSAAGEFHEPLTLLSGNDSLIHLDLNNDSYSDFISTDDSGPRNGFSIILSNGDGTFNEEVFYSTEERGANSIIGEDINNDNITDLIVITSNYYNDCNLVIYIGNNDGVFTKGNSYQLTDSINVGDFTTGDFNKDSNTDVVINNYILFGNGDGTFDEAVLYTELDLNQGYSVKSFDFNQDDNLDVVIINTQSPNIYILFGNGDGTFLEPTVYLVGISPANLFLADLNNDGRIDIANTNWSSSSISILLGNEDGTFSEASFYEIENGQPDDIYVNDLNKDDYLDIFVSEGYSDKFAVYLGNGDGTFKNPQYYDLGVSSYNIIADDFNNDGGIDVALLNYDDIDNKYVVSVFFNKNLPITEGEEEIKKISIDIDGPYNYLNFMSSNIITENGDYIVFTSFSGFEEPSNVYIYDKNDDSVELIGESPVGSDEVLNYSAHISEDGNYIAVLSVDMSGEDVYITLYNRSLQTSEKIDLSDLETESMLMLFNTMTISNNGDIVFSSIFYVAMISLIIGEEKESPFGNVGVYFYNNNTKELSTIDQLVSNISEEGIDAYAPYEARITSDGEEIIYNTIRMRINLSDPENSEQKIISENISYFVSKEEKKTNTRQELIQELTEGTMIGGIGTSISSDGRYLSSVQFTQTDTPEEVGLNLVVYDKQKEEFKGTSSSDDVLMIFQSLGDSMLLSLNTDISNNGRYALISVDLIIEGMDFKTSYPLFIYDNLKNESRVLGQDDGGIYLSADISSDGKYITFTSPNQLTDDDNDELLDVFLMQNPLYEEEIEIPTKIKPSRRTGTSLAMLEQFKQEQIQKDIPTEEQNNDDHCSNIEGIQSEVPSGLIKNTKGECFYPEQDEKTENKITPEKIESEDSVVQPQVETPIIEEADEVVDDDTEKQSDVNNVDSSSDESTSLVFGNSFSKIVNFINENIFPVFNYLFKDSIGKTIPAIVTTTGATIGIYLGLFKTIFLNPISLSEIPIIPIRLWNLMMIAFGFKKKTRPWGTVYDSVTKQPLDPVYVVVSDLNDNEVATGITDLDGRYGFLLPPGKYKIKVGKNNYQFPSLKLEGKTTDIIYNDLYFGENIEIKEEGEVVTKDIPMDSISFDWNEFTKKDKKLMKFFSEKDLWVTKISSWLFNIGFIFSLIVLFVNSSIYNTCIFTVYILIAIIKHTIIKPKLYGQVKHENGTPLSFSVLRFFRVGSESEIIHKVADQYGKYYCLIPNGSYYSKIEAKMNDESYKPVYVSEPIEVKRGYIDSKFII